MYTGRTPLAACFSCDVQTYTSSAREPGALALHPHTFHSPLLCAKELVMEEESAGAEITTLFITGLPRDVTVCCGSRWLIRKR